VNTQTSPTQRVAAIRARVQAITGALAGIDQAEQQRLANVARTLPELKAAQEAYDAAKARLEQARAAHGHGDTLGLGAITRRGLLERERDELEAELATDLAPWAGL
jgi:multidrug efflux pump subunit AcrA (membrane-fusion protein)